MNEEIIHNQSPLKNVTELGLNSRLLDQQLESLPIALQGPALVLLNVPLWKFSLVLKRQCGILTSVDSDEPVQIPFKPRNSKRCSVSSSIAIECSSD